MNVENTCKLFANCYTDKNFMQIQKYLHKRCSYQSHDNIYKYDSKSTIIEFLQILEHDLKSEEKETLPFLGFYYRKGYFSTSLKRCVIICDKDTYKCKSIIYFNVVLGKIISISGYNPESHRYIRGKEVFKKSKV